MAATQCPCVAVEPANKDRNHQFGEIGGHKKLAAPPREKYASEASENLGGQAMDKMSYLSWVLGPVLQAIVLGFMIRRKVHTIYPRFFSYIVFQILKSGVLFLQEYSGFDGSANG